MNSALASRPLAKPSNRLSPEGKLLVADLRDVIEKAKVLLLTKNEGDLLQNFIYQCTQVSLEGANTPNAPVDKETAKQHGNEALEGLKTLGTLLISNGQFRKLINDALILLRDMGGDAAANLANVVKPSEDDLAQVDRPADDNTWHDVPTTEDLKGKLSSAVDKANPIKKQDPQDVAADAQTSAQAGQTKTDSANAAAGTVKDRINEEHKENARKALNKTKDFFNEKMPEERRDQTIWRLKKMVVEIQGHPDCEFQLLLTVDMTGD